jgi:hypothetical protein
LIYEVVEELEIPLTKEAASWLKDILMQSIMTRGAYNHFLLNHSGRIDHSLR